jgi:HlyD family secretion protein
MKWIRWLVLLVAVGAAVVAAIWWTNSQAVLIDVASVARGSLVESLRVEGATQASDRRVVAAPVAGIVRLSKQNIGDAIAKNEELAVIEALPAPLLDERTRRVSEARLHATEAELSRAESARKLADNNLRDVQKRKNSLTPVGSQARLSTPDFDAEEARRKLELEAAERQEERAEYELEAARASLDLSPSKTDEDEVSSERSSFAITSPIDGNILRIATRDGELAAVGTPIIEAGNLRRLEFVFDVTTDEATKIKIGGTVELRSGNDSEFAIKGRISAIDQTAHRVISPLGVEERRTRVVVEALDGEKVPEVLGDGFRIEGDFRLNESSGVLMVPLGALFRESDAWFVFRVHQGRAVKTRVELGSRNNRDAAVISGLSDYNLLVLYPNNRVQHGSRVLFR